MTGAHIQARLHTWNFGLHPLYSTPRKISCQNESYYIQRLQCLALCALSFAFHSQTSNDLQIVGPCTKCGLRVNVLEIPQKFVRVVGRNQQFIIRACAQSASRLSTQKCANFGAMTPRREALLPATPWARLICRAFERVAGQLLLWPRHQKMYGSQRTSPQIQVEQ